MKITVTALLALLPVFVLGDLFRVIAQWNDYKIENVLAHSFFAAGVFTMACFNFYFIKSGESPRTASQVKFFLSLIGQLLTLFLFSNLILLVLIGCKPCDATELTSDRLVSFAILLSLTSIFVWLILWSKKLCLPNRVSQFPEAIQKAHIHSTNHRKEVENSNICGCFYCCNIFLPGEIFDWVDENDEGIGQCALCPRCGIDSVIGSLSGFPIDKTFLREMKRYWF